VSFLEHHYKFAKEVFTTFGKKKKRSASISNDDTLKKNVEFLSWIQEFSKKIVFITFFIFILANIFFLVIVTIDFIKQGTIQYLDTYISEIHLTFRDVIGGYMIKAATENVFKIGGGYMESYMKTKTTIVEKQMMVKNGIKEEDIKEEEQNPEEDSPEEE
jgi:hypothetical protein